MWAPLKERRYLNHVVDRVVTKVSKINLTSFLGPIPPVGKGLFM
jgi:hypothetical protein